MLSQYGRRVLCRQHGREMSRFADRVTNPDVQKNIWVEFVGLAMEHKALNLGQGK